VAAQNALRFRSSAAYIFPMSNTARPLPELDDEAAELAALTDAVNEALADPRAVPHAEMREWLLQLAEGNFDAPAPVARKL
jgi:Fe-S-cluster formation regulator IscX/YfhJ